MRSLAKLGALAVCPLLLMSVFSTSAEAAPVTRQPFPSAGAYNQLTKVYWRRGWGWGWGPRWRGPGAVVGGIIIGGALVASAIAEHRATDYAIRRCADDFPGFDPRSGTFVNRYGERRVCPYLY